jgi:hypothetical protein
MDTLLLPSIQRQLGSAANQEAFDKAFGLPSLTTMKKGESAVMTPPQEFIIRLIFECLR